MAWPLLTITTFVTYRQTDRQTDGHGNSMITPAQKLEVKYKKSKKISQLNENIRNKFYSFVRKTFHHTFTAIGDC